MDKDEYYMRAALLEAEKAMDAGEVPVGAVLVEGDKIIARGYNNPLSSNDSTAHDTLRFGIDQPFGQSLDY